MGVAVFGLMARLLRIEYPGAMYPGRMYQTGFTTAANYGASILGSDPISPSISPFLARSGLPYLQQIQFYYLCRSIVPADIFPLI